MIPRPGVHWHYNLALKISHRRVLELYYVRCARENEKKNVAIFFFAPPVDIFLLILVNNWRYCLEGV